MTQTSTWTVSGMTCAHCVASVTEEVSEIAGVEAVEVSLDSGQLSVTSSEPVSREQVEQAVTEAGYSLV